ncbi:hypothetical protein [Cupriavidus basilensis]|uniref:Type II secretion system protein GspC N-terminal domain-containing protein n=1 Tax=Cupriavidus basilensis TaxID=68895 RepID=A0A7M2HB47_9BURK|nr:hypothetical protein [Cupriavidus basilensis]QOT82186.1 hypothetical protein F7R26_039010 [Cupriavidus basilensis]
MTITTMISIRVKPAAERVRMVVGAVGKFIVVSARSLSCARGTKLQGPRSGMGQGDSVEDVGQTGYAPYAVSDTKTSYERLTAMTRSIFARVRGSALVARFAHPAVYRQRLLTLVCALACIAAAGYWGTRLHAARQASVPASKAISAPFVSGEGARLFGARPAKDSELPIMVSGVIRTGRDAGEASGAAVIAVNGKPPRLVLTGREAAPGLVLEEVGERLVVLSSYGVRREVRMAAAPKVPVLSSFTTIGGHEWDDGAPALVSNVPRAGSQTAVK